VKMKTPWRRRAGWLVFASLAILGCMAGSLAGATLPVSTQSSGGLSVLVRSTELPSGSIGRATETPAGSMVVYAPTATDFVEVFSPPETSPTPDKLPDYPIPSPTGVPPTRVDGHEPDPSAVTRIIIPAIYVDTVVKFVPFEDDSWAIGGLKQEVAWMGNTSWPGLGSNTGLAGHVDLVDGSDGPFRHLYELRAGDKVILYTEKRLYNYKVRAQVIVDESDLSVIAPTTNAQITLITCTDWDAQLRQYLKRLIVYADLVDTTQLP